MESGPTCLYAELNWFYSDIHYIVPCRINVSLFNRFESKLQFVAVDIFLDRTIDRGSEPFPFSLTFLLSSSRAGTIVTPADTKLCLSYPFCFKYHSRAFGGLSIRARPDSPSDWLSRSLTFALCMRVRYNALTRHQLLRHSVVVVRG